MMDYISDTISYDEKSGLKSPDAKNVVLTTTCEGDFLCDMTTKDHKKYVKADFNLKNAKMRSLNQRLWIEGNTSIAYGPRAGEPDGDLFSLTFFPEEMNEALDISLKDVKIAEVASDTAGKFGAILDKVVSFPYAQHMLSDAPGVHTHYESEQALKEAALKTRF